MLGLVKIFIVGGNNWYPYRWETLRVGLAAGEGMPPRRGEISRSEVSIFGRGWYTVFSVSIVA